MQLVRREAECATKKRQELASSWGVHGGLYGVGGASLAVTDVGGARPQGQLTRVADLTDEQLFEGVGLDDTLDLSGVVNALSIPGPSVGVQEGAVAGAVGKSTPVSLGTTLGLHDVGERGEPLTKPA